MYTLVVQFTYSVGSQFPSIDAQIDNTIELKEKHIAGSRFVQLISLSKYIAIFGYMLQLYQNIKFYSATERMRIVYRTYRLHMLITALQSTVYTFSIFTGTEKYKLNSNKTFKMAKAIINLITFMYDATLYIYLLHESFIPTERNFSTYWMNNIHVPQIHIPNYFCPHS